MSKLLGQKSSKSSYADLIITFEPEKVDLNDDEDEDLPAPIVRYYFESE